MAADVKTLFDHYEIKKAHIVGHDIGLMVAYAFAAKYPESTQTLTEKTQKI
ncbi:MAG: alpha/beta hydrolase [Rhizobacter sp.]|nr:alpha/beta hydrolase [Bacteriovorax sp.]